MTVSRLSVRRPAVDGLFTWPGDESALIAGHCTGCGTYSFPALATCINPACRGRSVEKKTLGRKGTLWTYTIHHYRPPAPFICAEPFEPYAIGVVELPEGLKVIGMLTVTDPGLLRIGDSMELVVDVLATDETGAELLTWKFAPCRDAGHA